MSERATTMPAQHRERPCRGIDRMTSTGSGPDLESAEVDNEAVWQGAVSRGGRETRRALATWDSSTRRVPTEERWLHAIDASRHFTDVCSCRAVAYDDWLRFLNRAPREIWNRWRSEYNFRCLGRCRPPRRNCPQRRRARMSKILVASHRQYQGRVTRFMTTGSLFEGHAV